MSFVNILDSGSDIIQQQHQQEKNKIAAIEHRKPHKAKTVDSDLKSAMQPSKAKLELNRRLSAGVDNNSTHLHRSAKQKLRNVIGRFGKAFRRVQNRAEEVLNHSKESDSDSDDGVLINEAAKTIKYRSARCNKTSFDFAKTQIVQIINIKSSSSTVPSSMQSQNSKSIIWSMKFSGCGKLLATGGKDQILRVWILKAYYAEFVDLKQRYNEGDDELINGEILHTIYHIFVKLRNKYINV